MRRIKLIGLVSMATLVLSSNSFAQSPQLSTGFEASRIRTQIRQGIDLLYRGQTPTETCVPKLTCPQDLDREELVDQAVQTKVRFDSLLANYQIKDVEMTRMDRLETVYQLKYPSPLQRAGSKSNHVFGYLYRPYIPPGCDHLFPGTVLIHHVGNDVGTEQMIAKLAASQYRGVVVMIFLPGYGPRKQSPDAPFFPESPTEFREVLLQSLLDAHIAGEILAQDSIVDSKNIQIGGLSLGAIVAATSIGLDPLFKTALIGLGGGDLAGIMTVDKHKISGVIREALKSVTWNRDETRKIFAPLDPLTWAYTVKGKNIIVLNAQEDELIDHKMSFLKLIEGYQSSPGANVVKSRVHEGTHVPDYDKLGFQRTLGIYYQVLSQSFDFLGKSQAAAVQARCASQN